MKNQDLLHVKLGYDESAELKRDLLSTEIDLLKTIEIARKYNFLRKKEIEFKVILYKRIQILLKTLKNLKKDLPTVNPPEEYERDEEIEKPSFNVEDLEAELQELNKKLKTI